MTQNKNRIVALGMLLLIWVFASCAVFRNIGMPPEEALRNRVAAYWDARVEGNAEKAYEIIDPEARKSMRFAIYAQRTGNVIILSYKIDNVEMDLKKNEATVRVERSFRIRPGAIPINIDDILEQTTDEQWVLIDGQWYMSYTSPAINFMSSPPGQDKNSEKN